MKYVVVLSLILRICGGSAAFLFAKGWGFYPASSVGTQKKVFSHAYMQVIMIFLGEAFVGLLALKGRKARREQFQWRQLGYFVLPALLDAAAQTFSNLGIGGELISVQQIFRLQTLLFQTPMQLLFSKDRAEFKENQTNKVFALIILAIGQILTIQVSHGFTQEVQPDCGSTFMSALFVTVSCVLSALYGLATRPYAKLQIHPLETQAIEAVIGLMIYCLAGLPVLAATKLEAPGEWAAQHASWYILLNQFLFVAAVFCVTCGGYLGVKHASQVAFQATEALRPLLITAVSWCCGFERLEVKWTLVSLSCQGMVVMSYVLFFRAQKTKEIVKMKQQTEQLIIAQETVNGTGVPISKTVSGLSIMQDVEAVETKANKEGSQLE